MHLKNILDKFVSNVIVSFTYFLVSSFWYYIYFNHLAETALLFYFPYGIIILSFLFFGNKIIFGLLLFHIIFYFILLNYNIDPPFNNYILISLCQLISVPITLLVLQKFNIKLRIGKSYMLDKTNIYHVLLITFFSTVVLGILFSFYFLIFYNDINIINFVLGNFIGALNLIILMKILVNVPNQLRDLIKGN